MTSLYKFKNLLFIFLIFKACICFSQEHKSDLKSTGTKKNLLYGTLGIYYEELYATVMVNYERMLIKLPDSCFFQSFWLRAGVGRWRGGFDVTIKGWNFTSTASVLMGRKNIKLEIAAGPLFTYNSYYDRVQPLVNDRHLAGYFGIRYKKPDHSWIFRTGIGWPEFMYLSVGSAF